MIAVMVWGPLIISMMAYEQSVVHIFIHNSMSVMARGGHVWVQTTHLQLSLNCLTILLIFSKR